MSWRHLYLLNDYSVFLKTGLWMKAEILVLLNSVLTETAESTTVKQYALLWSLSLHFSSFPPPITT